MKNSTSLISSRTNPEWNARLRELSDLKLLRASDHWRVFPTPSLVTDIAFTASGDYLTIACARGDLLSYSTSSGRRPAEEICNQLPPTESLSRVLYPKYVILPSVN